jgi:hypothetical protein
MKIAKILDFTTLAKTSLVIFIGLASSSIIFSQENKKCSAVIEGLEFCADSTALLFRLGDSVIVPLSVHNTTQEEKLVKSVPEVGPPLLGYPPYEFSVTDENGNKFPTIEDDLRTKRENGTITEKESNELFLRCCINKGSRWGNALKLDPGQSLKFQANLSEVYNFRIKGKYYLEIRRNVLAQNKKDIIVIQLERISIEVK